MEETEISVFELLKMLVKNWILMLLFLVLGVVVGIVYTMFIMKEEYTSSASLLVVMSKESSEPKEYDYNNSLMLINTVSELSKQSIILEPVATKNQLDLIDLDKMVSVTNPSSSLVLIITVKAPQQELAQKLADDIADTLIYECCNNPNLAMVGNALLKTSNATPASYTGHNKVIFCVGFLLIFLFLGGTSAVSKEIFLKKKKVYEKKYANVQNQLENI